MLLVKECIERGVERLDLRFRRAAQEAMALGELQRVAEHVQLGEGLGGGLAAPVLLDVVHRAAPRLDVVPLPFALVEEAIVKLLQPALEDGEGGLSRCGDAVRLCGSCEEGRAA